jgi:6,7-dimethyl-8-ribityllumazine synthase
MPTRHAKSPRALPPKVAIVVSRYNASITDPLEAGARREYTKRGGKSSDLLILDAPGSFELTAIAHAAAKSGRVSGVVALGCIIKGETSHDRYLADAVANGLTNITLFTGVPTAFGVLTVDTPQQAQDRAGGSKGNKGGEAMSALLDTIDIIKSIKSSVRRSPAGRTARPDKLRPNRP